MENKAEVLTMQDEHGNPVKFSIIEELRMNGHQYLLVVDEEDDEDTSYILKDVSAESDEDAVYDIVEDEDEFTQALERFRELLEGTDIALEE